MLSIINRIGAITTAALLSLATMASSCGSDDASFCSSAQSLQIAVSQLELEDVTAALGPEFWGAVQMTVDDIVRSTSGDFRDVAKLLQLELNALVERLEAVNYDLAKILLSPSVAADLAIVTAGLITFVSRELQSELATNCDS